MPDPSKSSFIPKRGPVTKRRRANSSRQVYVFTLISHILLFAVLLASGAVYFYQKHIETQLDAEVAALNTAIASFSETDMQRLLDFDSRLTQASSRLDASVSLVSVLEAIEDATIGTAQVQSLNIARVGDEQYELSATVQTDTFDSTIFQRGVYQRNDTVAEVVITNVRRAEAADTEGVIRRGGFSNPVVTFDAQMIVPLESVPYVVDIPAVAADPITIEAPALPSDEVSPAASGTPSESVESNQVDI